MRSRLTLACSMESSTRSERFDLNDPVHGAVPAVALLPARCKRDAELPVCLFLYGGGGTHETLLALEPLFSAAWRDGKQLVLADLFFPVDFLLVAFLLAGRFLEAVLAAAFLVVAARFFVAST